MSATCKRCGTALSPWSTQCPGCGEPLATAAGASGESEARESVRARLTAAARGDYEIVGELGRGGMGWVFLCRDLKLGRLAAVKVLPPLGALLATGIERFRREAETAARLTHPNIVPIYGVGGDMETPYFAMAYIDGVTLAQHIADHGAMTLDDALRLLREMGGALAYAHRQGVVHRDIKPQNVMIEKETGRALITDFGIARASTNDPLTRSGVAVGTPGYMAPEQAAGATDIDARADQYALAVVFFEMLTGRRLESFENQEWPISSSAVRRAAHRTRGDLPSGVVDALARAAAPRREDRWPSVDDFLATVDAGAPARGAGPKARGRRLQYAALGAGLALAVVGGYVALWGGSNEPGPSRSGPVPRAVALLPFDGDTAAADSLLPMIRYQLGGFTSVRVADARVFSPGQRADPATPDVIEAARRAGAAWILHGFVSSGESGREILARAVEVETGLRVDLGRVRVSSLGIEAADAVVLMLARGRPGASLGLSSAAGAAPVSLEAVHAFNQAEEAFRRADYSGAVEAYSRVIALDTGFAPARYKRFLAAIQQEPTEDKLRGAMAEIRGVVGRVGPLEQRLLGAYLMLFDSGNVTRAELELRALVAEDSTFLDGWFALGEVRYHFGALAGLPADSAAAAFERALALWPEAAPALMHLIALNLWLGREREARELIDRYLAQDSTSPVGRTIALGKVVLFGSTGDQRAVMERLGRVDERVLEFGSISGATTARDRTDLVSARVALDEMTRPGRSPRVRSEGARFLVASYLAEGRWSDAKRELNRMTAALPGDIELTRWPAVAFLLGYGSTQEARRAVGTRMAASTTDASERAVDVMLAGTVAVRGGDLPTARRYAAELSRAAGAPASPPVTRGMSALLAAMVAESSGDTVGAAAGYARGLGMLDAARAPFSLLHSGWLPRWHAARLAVSRGDTAGALALLEAQDFLSAFADQVVRGPAWLLRARLLEGRGDITGAGRYLRRAANLLQYAEGPLVPVRDSARASLERLGLSQ